MGERWTVLLIATAVVGAAALAYLTLAGGPTDPLARDLAGVGVALELPAPAEAVQVVAPAGVLSEGIYRAGGDRLRVRVAREVEPADGDRLAEEEKALLFGLFEDHQAPYPGALSTTLRCADEHQPALLHQPGEARFLVGLYANDRYAFGGCADDLLRYRATVGAWYDAGRRKLVRIEYFEPREGATDRGAAVLRSFRWVAP